MGVKNAMGCVTSAGHTRDRSRAVPAVVSPINPGPRSVVTSYYFSDFDGDVDALVSPSGMILAQYEYDPFGNLIAKGGLMADLNKYRFSSKEWEQNAGLYYYGYRFYDPNLQRWLNRDPLGEIGFEAAVQRQPMITELPVPGNRYLFAQNSLPGHIDAFGLEDLGPVEGPNDPYGGPFNPIEDPSDPESLCNGLKAQMNFLKSQLGKVGVDEVGVTLQLDQLAQDYVNSGCTDDDGGEQEPEPCPTKPTPAPAPKPDPEPEPVGSSIGGNPGPSGGGNPFPGAGGNSGPIGGPVPFPGFPGSPMHDIP